MLDSIVHELEIDFKNIGDPNNNPSFYVQKYDNNNRLYKINLEVIKELYKSFELDWLKEALATKFILPTILAEYKGDIDSLITNIKKHYLYNKSEIIFIMDEISNIDDLNKLKDAFPQYEIIISWDNDLALIDEVISGEYMIDYYKSLIDDNLSPLEKVTLAYDIVKSHNYKEDKNNPKTLSSRTVPKMVNNTNIVCVGYVSLFNRLLKELGIEAYVLHLKILSNNKVTGHQRSVVKLTDSKYNVNGYYIFDPTNDSDNQLYLKNDNNKSLKTYTPKEGYRKTDKLTSYTYFLVPFCIYDKKFPNSFSENMKMGNVNINPHILNDLLHIKQLRNMVNSLSIIDFVNLIYKIKIEEGYPKNMIPQIIQDSLLLSNYGFFDIDDIMKYVKEDKIINNV